MERLKVLVCGDRSWTNTRLILECMKALYYEMGYDTLIEGEARGADKIAANCAHYLGMAVLDFPADWEKFGKAAGPIRNQRMLTVGKPDLVVAFHNNIEESRGTKDMINKAKKACIPCYLISEKV